MRSSRPVRKPAAQQQDVILFSVGATTFAIAAGAVDEIRSLDGLAPFQASFASRLAKVRHTLTRENKDPGQTYFVVDSAAHLQTGAGAGARVMVLRGLNTALLVDAIDRMTQVAHIHPLPRAFRGAEREWYRGLAVADGRVIPVVNEESFLTRGELAALRAQLPAAQGVSA